MKLIPLLDRTGTTTAWADRQTGWVSDLTGKVFALVAFDGVSTGPAPRLVDFRAATFKTGTVM
jgi:hypothetical protein